MSSRKIRSAVEDMLDDAGLRGHRQYVPAISDIIYKNLRKSFDRALFRAIKSEDAEVVETATGTWEARVPGPEEFNGAMDIVDGDLEVPSQISLPLDFKVPNYALLDGLEPFFDRRALADLGREVEGFADHPDVEVFISDYVKVLLKATVYEQAIQDQIDKAYDDFVEGELEEDQQITRAPGLGDVVIDSVHVFGSNKTIEFNVYLETEGTNKSSRRASKNAFKGRLRRILASEGLL